MLLCAHGCMCLQRAEEGVGSPGTGGTGGLDFLILVLGTKLQSSEE